jgi:putative FmdB family regulatory protein
MADSTDGYASRPMPIYEYRCRRGHTFEAIQRMSDDAFDTCEVCGAPAERVMHAPAVHFKGSGFYNTDYGTKKRAREKSAADASSKSDKSDKSSDSSKSGDSGSTSTKPASDGPAKKAGSGATSSSAA